MQERIAQPHEKGDPWIAFCLAAICRASASVGGAWTVAVRQLYCGVNAMRSRVAFSTALRE